MIVAPSVKVAKDGVGELADKVPVVGSVTLVLPEVPNVTLCVELPILTVPAVVNAPVNVTSPEPIVIVRELVAGRLIVKVRSAV